MRGGFMKETWDSRIKRAERLASERPESEELLAFYAALLRSQKEVYEYLRTRRGWAPSGALDQDLPVLRVVMPKLLATVEACGSDALAGEARSLLKASNNERDEMLIRYWRAPSDVQFFAKAFLQPYARWLVKTGVKPAEREPGGGENRCPFCDGKPQVSVLQIKEPSSESGGRDLICAMCLTSWPYRRVACASCGEEDPAKIGYFHSPGYDHIRVEACEACKYYIKSVDLTRLGYAVPLVDEVAAAPLDLWAREHGYTKIEMNLVGL
jgi:FdhE protein